MLSISQWWNMKNKFLYLSMNYILKNKSLDSYNQIKIKYGLEVMYHFITKLIFVLICAILLKISKIVLLMILFFGPLRACIHGVHSNSNVGCWISTIADYILFGLYLKYIPINSYIFYCVFVIALLSYFLFAPSDTKHRPLVGRNNRIKLKIKAILLLILEFIISFLSNKLRPFIFYSCCISSIIINPTIYRLIHSPLNNFKNY